MFLLLIITVLFYLLYYITTRKFDYWKRKKVPFMKPKPLLGNYGKHLLQKESSAITLQNICRKFPNEPYVGAYYGTEPVLIVQDPELLKIILTKDFNYFHGRNISDHNAKERAGMNLFEASGDMWKVLRHNLTPLFSTAKMKNMFHLIQQSAYMLESLVDEEVNVSESLDLKFLSQRFTMTSICSCAFGVESNTMGKEVEASPFKKMSDILFDISTIKIFKQYMRGIWPSIFYGLRLQVLSDELDFFVNLVNGVIKERNYKPTSRNDFIDLLMGWYQKGEISGEGMRDPKTNEAQPVTLKVDDNLVVAQSFLIFATGFETAATTLAHTLFELAKDKAAQNHVQDEIDAFLQKNGNQLNYECVAELPYLEACIEESLRLYPVLGMLTREVMTDYTLPTGLHLEKGLRIHVPVYHMHHHSEHFFEPEKFVPERFFGEAKRKVNPYTYMPFGGGPRICIGMRFAKMQMFAGLITLLKKYQVELAQGMSPQLTMDPKSFSILTGKINLKLTVRDGWEQRVFVKN